MGRAYDPEALRCVVAEAAAAARGSGGNGTAPVAAAGVEPGTPPPVPGVYLGVRTLEERRW